MRPQWSDSYPATMSLLMNDSANSESRMKGLKAATEWRSRESESINRRIWSLGTRLQEWWSRAIVNYYFFLVGIKTRCDCTKGGLIKVCTLITGTGLSKKMAVNESHWPSCSNFIYDVRLFVLSIFFMFFQYSFEWKCIPVSVRLIRADLIRIKHRLNIEKWM